MEAKAIAKTVRIAPRKVRLVVDLIRGKSVAEAAAILRLTPKGSSVVVEKVLKSAAANAVNNNKMDQKSLYRSSFSMRRCLRRAGSSCTPREGA